MKNVTFISYSQQRDERVELVKALAEHGITPWRDVENLPAGQPTRQMVEQAIEHSSGAILWLSKDALRSDYVCDVEVALLHRALEQRGILLMPVFDGYTPSAARSALVERTGLDLGEQHGHVVDADVTPAVEARRIAAAYVGSHVRALPTDDRPRIRAVTRADTASNRGGADLNFDWRHHFLDGAVPDEGARTAIGSAMHTAVTALIDTRGAGEIELQIAAHLPLAVAIGHSLRRPTGCIPVMPGDSGDYRPDLPADDVAPLERRRRPGGDVASRSAYLEVSISRNVTAKVDEAVQRSGRGPFHRTALEPVGGPSQLAMASPEQAASWAMQIGDEIATLNDNSGVDGVDLYYAGPIQIAVMIGWWLNATGPVIVHHLAGNKLQYEALWRTPLT